MADFVHENRAVPVDAAPLQVSDGRRAPESAARAPGRRFLLLGGPFGSFFGMLGDALRARGAHVFRVNLHGAEAINWGLRASVRFNRPFAEWPGWIAQYMAREGITDLVVYGDCQIYTRAALDAARRLGVVRHVFESGYFRPDWVTYEANGVNGYSGLPRDPGTIRREGGALERDAAHEKIGTITPWHVKNAFFDYFKFALGWPLFFRYRWPYLHGQIAQAFGSTARLIRVNLGRARVRRQTEELRRQPRPYYLCLLQREGDSQILFHSGFGSVAGFYEAVMQDFVRNAPANALLVFKNHPLDPGVHNHGKRIFRLARTLNVESRVRFFDSGNLADLAKPARGVVTINSTAGISTVQFGVPTIALGDAIYNMPGLTHQGGLASFWRAAERPDVELFRAFHRLVLARTQINGNFYAPRGQRIALEACANRLMQAADVAAAAPRVS